MLLLCGVFCRHECPVRLASAVGGQCWENSQHTVQGSGSCPQDRPDAQHTRYKLKQWHCYKTLFRSSVSSVSAVSFSDNFFFFYSDNTFINPQLQKIFERVRQSADFMPIWQMNVSLIFLFLTRINVWQDWFSPGSEKSLFDQHSHLHFWHWIK